MFFWVYLDVHSEGAGVVGRAGVGGRDVGGRRLVGEV